MALPATRPTGAVPSGAVLSADQLLELYYYLRLTRTLEERLVALHRQTKVIGGLFRSLGQEGESVASAYALERGRHRDILSPLIRNLGSLLVMGAQPIEILRQYMAKADSPTRGRELNVHFNDLEKGYLGQISHLGDMIPVTVDGNDVFAVYEATRFAVERARRGKGVHFIEVKTYRRKGHAEHDDQHYVPKTDLERWAKENDPIDRYTQRLLSANMVAEGDLRDIDDRVRVEVDQATDACVDEPLPPAESALPGVYVDPAAADKLWFKLL